MRTGSFARFTRLCGPLLLLSACTSQLQSTADQQAAGGATGESTGENHGTSQRIAYPSDHLLLEVNGAASGVGLGVVADNDLVVTPDLPAGLTLDKTTGAVGGTPTTTAPEQTYTVTGHVHGAAITATFKLAVIDQMPAGLQYNGPFNLTLNSVAGGLPVASVSGGTNLLFAITPALPAGLALNPTTGAITGTPTATSAATTYTATATNVRGSASATLTLRVDLPPPGAFTAQTPAQPFKVSRPTLTWTASSGHAGYHVEVQSVADCSGTPVQSQDLGAGATSVTTTDLTDGNYWLCVSAVGTDAQSTTATGSPTPFVVQRWYWPYAAATIAEDALGNTYLGGKITADRDFDPGVGNATVTTTAPVGFVVKLDSQGDFNRAWTFAGGSAFDVVKVLTDAGNNVLIVGSATGTVDFDPTAGTDSRTVAGGGIFVTKLLANGNYAWTNIIPGVTVNDAAIDSAGNVHAEGYFYGTVDFDWTTATQSIAANGYSDIFYTKFNADGSYGGTLRIGGGLSDSGWLGRIAVTATDEVLIADAIKGSADVDPGAGTVTLTGGGQSDVVVVKLSAAGAFQWGRIFTGAAYDYASAVSSDADGNVYVTGYCGSANLDLDPGTATVTRDCAGGNFLVKLTNAGAYVWGRSTKTSFAWTGGASAAGDFYHAAEFSGTVDFDIVASGNQKTAVGGNDLFITKINADGSYGWTKTLGSTGAESLASLKVMPDGRLLISGAYAGSASFSDFDDPNTRDATTYMTAGFVIKYP